jgi:uncharacterized protein (DUF302 family)
MVLDLGLSHQLAQGTSLVAILPTGPGQDPTTGRQPQTPGTFGSPHQAQSRPFSTRRVVELLKDEGFGVLTEIDVRQTLKQKLDLDVRPYRILGACNPTLAHRALEAEPGIGLLLPCNVVLEALPENGSSVRLMDATAALGLVGNPDLAPIAAEATERLRRVAARPDLQARAA